MRCCHLLQYFVTRSFNESYLQIRYHLQGGQKVRQIYLVAHCFERSRLIVLWHTSGVFCSEHIQATVFIVQHKEAPPGEREPISFFFLSFARWDVPLHVPVLRPDSRDGPMHSLMARQM